MKNNELEVYKESVFVRIHNFIKRIFCRKKTCIEEVQKPKEISTNPKNIFFENIQIKENKEDLRWIHLKQQYEQREIDEEDLSTEEIDKLCEMYEKETDELNTDTERRKKHIAQMLKELKNV
jgi:ABC-type proline/glycine betaine transport system ATPase subunit